MIHLVVDSLLISFRFSISETSTDSRKPLHLFFFLNIVTGARPRRFTELVVQ